MTAPLAREPQAATRLTEPVERTTSSRGWRPGRPYSEEIDNDDNNEPGRQRPATKVLGPPARPARYDPGRPGRGLERVGGRGGARRRRRRCPRGGRSGAERSAQPARAAAR